MPSLSRVAVLGCCDLEVLLCGKAPHCGYHVRRCPGCGKFAVLVRGEARPRFLGAWQSRAQATAFAEKAMTGGA